MLACQGGSLSIVNAVIDLFDVGLQDENGESALYHAAYQENVALVQLLLSRGAPVNAMTRWSGTALLEAMRTNRYANAQLLIEWGASIDCVDENGRCLTELARTADMLKLLVSMGARPSESQLVDRASRYIRSRLDVTTKKGIAVCYSLYRRKHLLSLV
jgi:ankyrin repeat protein